MKKKMKPVEFTPNLCRELLNHNTFQGQRPLSMEHVEKLGQRMVNGKFNAGLVALVHYRDENGEKTTELINGQHQLNACLEFDTLFEGMLVEHTAEESDTPEDIANVFAQYDDGRTRTKAHVAWYYGCRAGMGDWSNKAVTLFSSAFAWLAGGARQSSGSSLSKEDAGQLLAKNKEACIFMHNLLYGEDSHRKPIPAAKVRHLERAPVIAAIAETWKKNAEDAEIFWTSVRDGDMLKHNDPAFMLRDHLMNSSLHVTRTKAKKSVDSRELYAKCLMAWNAYRTARITHLRYTHKFDLPAIK